MRETSTAALTQDERIILNHMEERNRRPAEPRAVLEGLSVYSTQKSQQRYELFFENSRDIILMIRLQDGFIQEANPAAIQAYGYSREEILALTIQDLRSFDTAARVMDQMEKAAQVGITFQTRHRRKDGSTFPVEVSSTSTEIDGQRMLISMIRDITARKKVEDALRDSEERFRVAVMNTPAVYAQTDRDLRYTWVHCPHPDQTCEDKIGRTDVEMADTPESRRLMELKHKVLVSGQGLREEVMLKEAGCTKIYDMTIEPLRDARGEVVGVSTAAADIFRFKQAEEKLSAYAERLKRSNEELEQFSFVVSHDLQEPLRKIIRFGDSVKERLKPGMNDDEMAETIGFVDRMQKASLRLEEMIEGVLELARISTQGSHYQTIDLGEIAREVITDLEPIIQAAGAWVEVNQLPVVEADAPLMRQLLHNLISNALKFQAEQASPQIFIQGSVQVDKSQTGQATIEVTDNGIGFEERDIAWIFQPFRRLHRPSRYAGTGMGLAICQKIVARHHGQITVHSRPGSGSRFIVHLPLKQTG
jgi:two-component system sensor kinase FixL